MWLTGFDVECLSTLYVDKPMKAHNLMQAIARTNRIYPGKDCGVIVDYNGTLASPTYPNCGPLSFVSTLSPGLCRYDNAPFIGESTRNV